MGSGEWVSSFWIRVSRVGVSVMSRAVKISQLVTTALTICLI